MRIFRKLERSADLPERGIVGRATIESVRMLQQGEFRISAERGAEMMRGEGTPIRAKLGLLVAPVNGREPYRVELKTPVPALTWTRLGVGGTVAVLIDPNDAGRLEIDWEGEIVEPTLGQRAEHDPVLGELLARRVDPPPA